MSVDRATVKRVAHLARISVSDEEAEGLRGELNAILGFVEQLNEVDVVERRADDLRAAHGNEEAPRCRHRWREGGRHPRQRAGREGDYFLVPKVVE